MTDEPKPSNPELDLDSAFDLYEAGDLDRALVICMNILQHRPADYGALYLAGSIHLISQSEKSIFFLNKAIEASPDKSVAYFNLAKAYIVAANEGAALAAIHRFIELQPDDAEAHVVRGSIYHKMQQFDVALSCSRRAIELNPSFSEAFYNQGNALFCLKNFDDALSNYDRSISLKPDYIEAYVARGIVLARLKRQEAALGSVEEAIRQRPDYAEAYNLKANVLRELQRIDESIACYDKAIALKPTFFEAYVNRGAALASSNKDEALRSFQKALELGADREMVNFEISALGSGATAERAPRDFVRNLFDDYAERFDHHLVDVLAYTAPRKLVRQLLSHCPARELDVLDIGCGTGLCGQELKTISRHLVGVDISANMLSAAARKGVYDRLVESDLLDFISGESSSYDLVISADVFIYLGELDALFSNVRRLLRSGGWFSFSVERGDAGDFALTERKRYTHSCEYIELLAARHGFRILEGQHSPLRKEGGLEVSGVLFLLQAM